MRTPARRVRRPLSLLIALVVSFMIGSAGVALADTVPAAVLTTTGPASVATGKRATITGTLVTSSNKSIAQAAVVIRSRPVGSSSWSSGSSVTTSTKGAWSIALPLTVSTELRAEFAGSPAAGATTGRIITVLARQSVTLAASVPARPGIGQQITVSGTTSVPVRGSAIRVQRRVAGSWSTVAETTVSKTGTFAVKLRIKDAAALTLRAQSVKKGAVAATTSSSRTTYVAVTATLPSGGKLGTRRVLTSPNGLYAATLRTSGALVVTRRDGSTVWSSQTTGTKASLTMRTDGNLVLAASGATQWSTKTSGSRAVLVMQDDGTLVVWDRGRSLWSSTGGTELAPSACHSTSFDCLSFSGYTPYTSFWRMYAGHNCTNYVAYRMVDAGVTTPPWGLPGGSAWEWRAKAKKAKVPIDTTPTVGAVIQWNRNTNGGGRSGHVAYVERVTATSILISEDSWSGYGAVRTIRRNSATFTAARFLHVNDVGTSTR